MQKSVMSFCDTPCMLCIAAVLGKVMVTVFVASCLFTKGCLQSVFQQLTPNRKIRKSSGKQGLQGAGRSILIVWERKVTQVQSTFSQSLLPGLSNWGHSISISRTAKPVNCNWFFNALQAVFFSLPCKPEHTVISK